MDLQTQTILSDVVRRLGRSLLQYVNDSYPWTRPEERADLERVRQLAAEEGRAVADLVRFLTRQRVTPPYLGPYPMTFTNINFVSLHHLLPLLVEHERQTVTALESDVALLNDLESLEPVQAVLDLKRRHLETLENLYATPATMS